MTSRSSDRVLALLLAVVEGLSAARSGRTLTELADAVGLAPSTATRQLASLEAAGLVRRVDARYVPGPELVRVAHRVVADHPLPRLAQPLLEEVAAVTGETCVLAVPQGPDRALYVGAADGTHTLRVTGWRGREVPRVGSAVGRALGDGVPAGRVAVGRGTVEEGVTGVSAAVRDADATVVAAVSVLGPSARLRDAGLARAESAVLSACTALEQLIGS